MSRQILIAARDPQEAEDAIQSVESLAGQGDEIVVLLIEDVPSGEMIDTRPPSQVLDPLATTMGVQSEARAASDRPVMLGREEIMEMRGRELCEAVQPAIARLNDKGFRARVDAVFADEPGEKIRDVAGDLDVTDVYASADFQKKLDEESQALVRPL